MVHWTSAGVLSFTSVQAERGFVNLTGVDYSQTAIDLAQSVAEEKKYSISFAVSGNCRPFQRLFVHAGGGVRRGMKCSRELALQFSCLVEHLCQ